MPFIEVNGTQLYYVSYGEDQRNQAPVVLIHGSTQTGHSCWHLVAPLLAGYFRVIFPDCRGHGLSRNPGNSYSFKEMAADTAALVNALGYQKAHIIGHSNGGNVALVTLLEYPQVVQSAVLQAANAFVSPDLIEREPAIFDPERVARQAPDWRDEMIALHSPAHGAEYWRELLLMTVKEIISAPNYAAADLMEVDRPTLLIQGEDDSVNAPSRHAQFIAEHIPYAELWSPAQTGHTVHAERLFEWTQKILDFLTRRGDERKETLYRLKTDLYSDARTTVFDTQVELRSTGEKAQNLILGGVVLTSEQSQAAQARLAQVDSSPLTNELKVLMDQATWALIGRPVNDLRQGPSNRTERLSQALIGESVRVLEERQDWSWVRMERDGYLGWIQNAALVAASQTGVQSYQAACNARVSAGLLPAWPAGLDLSELFEKGGLAGKLPFGCKVMVVDWSAERPVIRLPSGMTWEVERAGLIAQEEWPAPDSSGIEHTLNLLEKFIGIPYLWGGRTPYGFDCSGLSQAFMDFIGISIPRDADQQFRAGQPVAGEVKPGDLLFFGEPSARSTRYTNITHVAISLGGTEIIHSNGPAWSVSTNSLNPLSPLYRPWLQENLAGVRRFV